MLVDQRRTQTLGCINGHSYENPNWAAWKEACALDESLTPAQKAFRRLLLPPCTQCRAPAAQSSNDGHKTLVCANGHSYRNPKWKPLATLNEEATQRFVQFGGYNPFEKR